MCALLEVDDLAVRFRTLRGEVHAVNGVDLRIDAGRDGRPRGRVGVRQDGHRPRHPRTTRAHRLGDARSRVVRRPRPDPPVRASAAPPARGVDLDDLPGSMASLNPVLSVGDQVFEVLRPTRPGSRGAAARQIARRNCSTGRHPARHAAPPAPPPVQRGDGPAGHDRDRHRRQPAPAARRRADHCPRRDRPGPSPHAAPAAHRRARHGPAPGHPRRRRHRRHLPYTIG